MIAKKERRAGSRGLNGADVDNSELSRKVKNKVVFSPSLRAGSLVWVGDKEPRTGEKNEARKSEPARELLIFEFRPSRGVKSAFHMCQKTIQ